MDKVQAERLIKKVLPSFQITGEVGKGAFGSVYRIKDELKERAAKIIPLHASAGIENGAVVSADSKIERDFRHIVESYERIACDEIVTVYDFYMVKDEGGTYALTVMEVYPASLSKFVIGAFEQTGVPLEEAVALKVIEKVAQMLGNLYSKMGFLFEDFKPENILIKEHMGDLKLVVGDIGGLKNVVSIALTASQVTPVYCAPEVIRKGQAPNLRSIIYSFGLLSFFILEGRLPYDDRGISARFDVIRDKGIPYSRKDVPETVKRTLEKCLSFEPGDRFADFAEVLKALRGQMPVGKPEAFSGETLVVGGSAQAPQAASEFSAGTISIGAEQPSAQPVSDRTVPLEKRSSLVRPQSAVKTSLDSVSILNEKELIEGIKTEIKGRVIKAGESFKISNDNYRVTGSLIVERNAVLSITGAKLFFSEGSGIVVMGAIRAKDSLFSTIDASKRWSNVTIYSTAGCGVSVLEKCRFHFGRGASGKYLRDTFNITRPAIHENGFYGGGLFIAGGMEKTLMVKDVTCYKCTAHEGGGMYLHRSKAAVEGCLFEGCTANGSGGAVALFESGMGIFKCTFNNCTSGKDGGGMQMLKSNLAVENCVFQSCLSKYTGGGIACLESSPAIKNCKFDRCASAKAGGGIYGDRNSKPRITFPSFSRCRPNDTNF